MQTVDFFTPIVDDPYVFGQIAAANALSDVYAMGGTPLTALAIAGFPKKGLESEVLARVFRGGYDKLREADVALLGGHTVQDEELKFGYAVTGSIDPDRILTNAGCRPGDVLLLTKPLGTGIVATAIKAGRAPEAVAAAAISSMTTLNRIAAERLRDVADGGVRACTDVTGFGLIGHASEMGSASQVTLRVSSGRLPLIDGVSDLVARHRTAGGQSNADFFGDGVKVAVDVDADRLALMYDPQTSGGLLAAVRPELADQVVTALEAAGVPVARVGVVEDRSAHLVLVEP